MFLLQLVSCCLLFLAVRYVSSGKTVLVLGQVYKHHVYSIQRVLTGFYAAQRVNARLNSSFDITLMPFLF